MANTILNLHYRQQIFQVKEISKDGLNFFRAISRALNPEETEETYQAQCLRSSICRQLEDNIQHYSNIVGTPISTDYLNSLRASTQEVGDLIIQAMADYQQMDILIIKPTAPKPNTDAAPTPDLSGTHIVQRFSVNQEIAGSFVVDTPVLIIYCDNRKLLGEKDSYSYVENSENLAALNLFHTLEGTLPEHPIHEQTSAISPISAPDLSNLDTTDPRTSQESVNGEVSLDFPDDLPQQLDEHCFTPPSPPHFSMSPSPALIAMMRDVWQFASPAPIQTGTAAAAHSTRQIYPENAFASFDSESDSDAELNEFLQDLFLEQHLKNVLKQKFERLSLRYWCLRTFFLLNPVLATSEPNIQALFETDNLCHITRALVKFRLYTTCDKVKFYKPLTLTTEIFENILKAGERADVFIDAYMLCSNAGVELTPEQIQNLIKDKCSAEEFTKNLLPVLEESKKAKEASKATVGEEGRTPIFPPVGSTALWHDHIPYHKTGETHETPKRACEFFGLYAPTKRVQELVDRGILTFSDVRSVPVLNADTSSESILTSSDNDDSVGVANSNDDNNYGYSLTL